MSPLRFFGSLIVGRLSSRRIGSQALGSARLRHQSRNFADGVGGSTFPGRLPVGESRVSAVTVGACLSILMGGMWYFKEDAEKPVALKQNHHEEAMEEETIEEKAMTKRFEDWMIKYDRKYKDKEEKAMRYELFKLTAQHVDQNNATPGTLCTLGTNQFADLTEEEFSWCCGGPRSIISGKEIMRRGYL
ncbi:uncharacterized protein LOC123447141 [Hordeum vulgare subsp. vulgare]|uniref:Cathepsin propeptide inhibitor domain-containing protein n=1 Tax=Hordeum vulgare subsp. vulgare TaxID=112509 RepID=A0A8I6XKK1_HORVV|nr:uncharacterized protein LOC123447141 [Hordeum vulgare subsp. vulgare]KAI4994912.1 hypothetical protein ZWY2020_034815 [Hordeum vulgare]